MWFALDMLTAIETIQIDGKVVQTLAKIAGGNAEYFADEADTGNNIRNSSPGIAGA